MTSFVCAWFASLSLSLSPSLPPSPLSLPSLFLSLSPSLSTPCRALDELFQMLNSRSPSAEPGVAVSYVEIYKEELRDLLDGGGVAQPLVIREDDQGNTGRWLRERERGMLVNTNLIQTPYRVFLTIFPTSHSITRSHGARCV